MGGIWMYIAYVFARKSEHAAYLPPTATNLRLTFDAAGDCEDLLHSLVTFKLF